jgi:hypothetical protein
MGVSVLDKEERQKKKTRRIAMAGAWSAGIGVGVLIARLISPVFMEPDEATNAIFSQASMALILYGIAQLASVLFLSRHAGKIDMILTYIVMPAVIIKIIIDYTS